jgi:hypothetical protein
MRYVIIGFCVFAAACTGASPTAPTTSATTSPTSSATTTPSSSLGQGIFATAKGGSELPFKGRYEGLETVGTPSSQHHLDATGNATHLGRFTVTASWTVTMAGAIETSSTWTAANGDELFTRFTRQGVFVPPTATFTETHTITGGTGRFATASGTFTVVQTRGLSMPYNNSATLDGTINLGH